MALGILGVVGALFLFPPLFARMAGWPQLAQRFAQAPELPRARIGYATLGILATAPVKLSASEEGLVLSLVFTPFRSVPPLLIPWRGVLEDTARSNFLIVPFMFPPASTPRLFLKPHVARRFRHYLALGGAA